MTEKRYCRICYIGSPALFTRGASAIHIMKMCQAMKRMGMDIELVLPGYDKQRNIFEYYGVSDRFNITTIPLASLPGRQILHGIGSAFYAWRNKDRFDYFLTRNIVFTFLATRFLGIKTMYDAHHPPVNSIARYMFNSFKDSGYLVRFSTNTRGLADIYLRLGLPPDKLAVAHNGVELERFDISEDIEELRDSLSLPGDRKIVCYCGNTYQGRGIENLIDVASRLTDTMFLVVGGLDDDNSFYRNIVSERGLENFLIRGHVPHEIVARYLKASDVLVIPYTSRMTIKGGTNASGFTSPIKLFEYMAAEKPIVITGLPTIREVVTDGEEVLLVEPDSSESLYRGLRRVLEDDSLSRRLAGNAYARVKDYTWEKRVERIFNGL